MLGLLRASGSPTETLLVVDASFAIEASVAVNGFERVAAVTRIALALRGRNTQCL